MLLVVGLIVLAAIAYFFFASKSKEDVTTTTPQVSHVQISQETTNTPSETATTECQLNKSVKITASHTLDVEPSRVESESQPEELTVEKSHSLPAYMMDAGEEPQSSSSIPEYGESTLLDSARKESKKTSVKGFDFRNKRPKTMKSSDSSICNAQSASLTSSPVREKNVASSDQDLQEETLERTLVKEPLEANNILTNNNATKPPLRGKGFNFRNPVGMGKKLAINTSSTHSSGVGSQPSSRNCSPTKENKENNIPVLEDFKEKELAVPEKKPMKGFNFRNASKVKAE